MQHLLSDLFQKYIRIIKFLVSGGSATLVDLGVLYVLVHQMGVWYVPASVVAFIVALVVSFTMQKFWTFDDRALRGMHVQIVRYVLLAIVDLGVNTLSLYVLVEFAGFRDFVIVAQAITALGIAVGNYFVYKYFIFNSPAIEASNVHASV